MSARLTDFAEDLRAGLQLALNDALAAPLWGHPEAMTRALKEVLKSFDSASAPASEQSIAESVWAFRRTGQIASFRDLKYVCYGLAMRQGMDESTLLGDDKLYPALMDEVHLLTDNPRRFRKCYQGLLSTYLNFPADESAKPKERANWEKLRAYLRKQLALIVRVEPIASWAKTLEAHENLLRTKPCQRYADALRKGQWDELEEVAAGLAISSQSWVWKEAVLAHVEAVAGIRADGAFRNELDLALHALEGKRFPLGDDIKRKGAASLVCRYARCVSRPEHGQLLDLALHCFGKPWLNRTAWDTYVGNDDARRLIDSWLKTGLIQDFFQLLAEDGIADRSRMLFWPKFVPVIDDIWFVLGTHARTSSDPNYVRLRNRIGSERIAEFVGAGYTNNAFIMRIGPYYMVEFGQIGRAAYLIHADGWRLDLRPGVHLNLGVATLRRMGGKQLTHMPNYAWGEKFEQAICPGIGWWPGQAAPTLPTSNVGNGRETTPSRSNVRHSNASRSVSDNKTASTDKTEHPFLASMIADLVRRGEVVQDFRSTGGDLWVLADQSDPILVRQLTGWGFRYEVGKGWRQ